MNATSGKPKLRKLDRLQLRRGDDVLIVLRDPTGLGEQVAFPQEAAPVLDALDGLRTIPQIRQSLSMRGLLEISQGDLEAIVRDLESAGLLDDAAFRARWEAVHRQFIAATVRPPRWAGVLYPDDPAALAATLDAVLPDRGARLTRGSDTLGVVLPHQPLPVGGEPAHSSIAVAAGLTGEVLQQLPAPDELDLVVAIGTDYHPGLVPFTVTDKRYATPRGELPGDPALVRALERRLPWIRREEIRHREALSLELAALSLQHLYEGACPPVLPVLCGPAGLELDGEVESFLATMEYVLEGRRVLWWVTAELSHDGPAYGRPPLASERIDAITERDRWCLAALADGRPELLARRCRDGDPSLGRPSGAAALATAARLFPVGYHAAFVAYAAGRPPGPDEGWVGLGGLRLVGPRQADDDDEWLTPTWRRPAGQSA